MARSFSNTKALSSLIANAISKRGFSAAAASEAAAVPKAGVSKIAAVAKKSGEAVPAEKVSWVPDPRTGVYRPANVAEEVDVAELRAMLLKKH